MVSLSAVSARVAFSIACAGATETGPPTSEHTADAHRDDDRRGDAGNESDAGEQSPAAAAGTVTSRSSAHCLRVGVWGSSVGMLTTSWYRAFAARPCGQGGQLVVANAGQIGERRVGDVGRSSITAPPCRDGRVPVQSGHVRSGRSVSAPASSAARNTARRRRARCRRSFTTAREQPTTLCDLLVAEAFPGHQAEQVRGPARAGWSQARRRGPRSRTSGAGADLSELLGERRMQRCAAALAAMLVGQHPPGHAVEPEARLVAVRDVAESSPGDEERIGNGVRRVFRGRGAAQRVADEPREVLLVEKPEARSRDLVAGTVAQSGSSSDARRPVDCDMSGSRRRFHGARATKSLPRCTLERTARPAQPRRAFGRQAAAAGPASVSSHSDRENPRARRSTRSATSPSSPTSITARPR